MDANEIRAIACIDALDAIIKNRVSLNREHFEVFLRARQIVESYLPAEAPHDPC